ncbi:single-stranded DNA-binding protein [Patescibacteria group bacterium]|nr:single-stranded DNA-binding protein [Patescibacteria group bacterium]MBU4353222.1 single-stranded DNA-binding protein [Patescibacteria group bacterium]MBU4477118.1 single-stranded DNA-binding protein [Patescibacteria group bacterium]MCG2698953.1 single-stranded DNA-binding protein [Candidatus Parcubacteria bacterium]
MNLNKAFIIGNLTRDPESRSLPSGVPVVSFGVATNRIWKNQQGQNQQDAQFHNIVVFGKLADLASQYLKKGSLVFVEGRIQTRNWDAQDGSKKNRTEIVAERIQFGPRRAESQGVSQKQKPESAPEELETIEYPEEDINPEEIPF